MSGVTVHQGASLPAVAAEESASMLSLIANAARDPSVDVTKLQALLQMQREVAADRARLEYNQAMARVQALMQPVLRDAENTQTKSRYARLESIDAALRPIYSREGFSLSFNSITPEKAGWIRITCTVAHAGGHVELKELEGPPDVEGAKGNVNKTPMHGLGSTVSYLRRYLTLMAFNATLTNEDDDGNAGGGRRSTRRPALTIDHGSTWLRGAFDQLVNARDHWNRLEILQRLFGEVPTEVDLTDLLALPLVGEMARDAPDDAKQAMADGEASARDRLRPPAPKADAAPPEDSTKKPASEAKTLAERDRILARFKANGSLEEHERAMAEEGDRIAWFRAKRPALSAEVEAAVRASLDRNIGRQTNA